jgi:hypothetical protein
MARAFVIRPFGTKKDSSGREIDFERVHRDLIKPALEANDLDGDTTGEIVEAGNIREDMFALILEADVVVCDITVHNANVFYEVGIRHALRKKSTLLIKGQPTNDTTPFDLLTDRYLAYDVDAPGDSRPALEKAIRASRASDRKTDSPIFQMVPALAEADPEKVQVVPPDLREELDRAATAKSRGWLRLLSEEIKGRRFERSGLKLVGKAQWKLQDWEGAEVSWERIRAHAPDDIDANLALANVFERQSRDKVRTADQRAQRLASSDQAIGRVFSNASATRAQRSEALALQGRNQKTHWRDGLDKPTESERRRSALKRSLIDCYESYLGAFRDDLNNYYPGVVAVQMGTILLSLSGDSGWNNLFKDNRAANNHREDLEGELPSLTSAVTLSVQSALARDEKDRWAKISDADVLFLTSDSDDRVTSAYEDAFSGASPFDWDAARGQLQLFADLGIKSDRATAVIARVEGVLGRAPAPKHVVVFVGHQFDTPGRQSPRFPSASQAAASALIKAKIQQLAGDNRELVLLASVSPGADLLFHEACAELGLRTTVCLPTPATEVGRTLFASDDASRSRFLDIIASSQKRTVLTLSDQPGLPKWLVETGADPWSRGNAWVIKMAASWGADRVTLLAFWDGVEAGATEGGTAHAVKLARDEGTFRIERVDSAQVLQAT